jgi:hypothetical protein
MPDIEALNGVADGDTQAVNGVAKADIQAINGVDMPSGTTVASRWVVGMTSDKVGYAANSDRTSWTFYDSVASSGEPDAIDIAYGKDNSGNGIYVLARDSSNKEINVSGTDVTTDAEWTVVNLGTDTSAPNTNNDCVIVRWRERSTGAAGGVWMAAGQQNNEKVYRSIDGAANWTAIDVSGLTGHTTAKIKGLDGDGNGNWMFGQEDRIYYSTDDGASFAVSTPFSGDSGDDAVTEITGVKYTNSSWVISYEIGGGSPQDDTFIRSCAASDITDWGSGVDTGAPAHVSGNSASRTSIASYNGRICVVPHKSTTLGYADVNGKTISNAASVSMSQGSTDRSRDVATDGTTWMIVTNKGDTWESTDNAASWSLVTDNMGTGTGGSSGDSSITVTPNVFGPL